MKSRRKLSIRRVTLFLGFLVLLSAVVLLALHWSAIETHLEVWRFQLSSDTVTISPGKVRSVSLAGQSFGRDSTRFELENVLVLLSDQSGVPVVYNPEDGPVDPKNSALPAGTWWPRTPSDGDYLSRSSITVLCTADMALSILAANGWRIMLQRFPRRAYIVTRDTRAESATEGLDAASGTGQVQMQEGENRR